MSSGVLISVSIGSEFTGSESRQRFAGWQADVAASRNHPDRHGNARRSGATATARDHLDGARREEHLGAGRNIDCRVVRIDEQTIGQVLPAWIRQYAYRRDARYVL